MLPNLIKSTFDYNKINMQSIKIMNLYKQIQSKLFDVSLRDGLQSLDKNMHHLYPTGEKKRLYYNIQWNYKPSNIEIGSLINPKIMPIMADSLELFKEICQEQLSLEKIDNNIKDNHYLLIPNKKKLDIAMKNDIRCFSLISSVSNSFQKKNTNMGIYETKEELKQIFSSLENMKKNTNIDYKTKLYISCINKCPIEGVINNNFIINEILYYYNNYDVNQICLSDTCGTLDINDYKYILDKCIYFGLSSSKIGIHLHFNANDNDQLLNAKKIVHYSFDKNIASFDVSELEYGGCSMTLKKEEIRPNMSYCSFNNFLTDYVETKCK